MTDPSNGTESTATAPTEPDSQTTAERMAAPGLARRSWKRHFSVANAGVIYVWILIIIVFSVWEPDTFFTTQTAKTILNQNAISGLVALALVVPLSAQVFDLSVGNALGLCNVIIAWLLVKQGVPMVPAILLTIGAGMLIGVINATIVIGGRIDSFIGTLATGSLMAAGVTLVTNDQAIIGDQLSGNFGKIATSDISGVQVPVFLMLGVAVLVWYLLNYTVTGRRIYATGFNQTGARLTGIHTNRLRFASLVVSGTVAGVGGILLCSQVSSGSPDIGPPYLLDAFAAAFLGATQFGGRFNAWGTVVAVLLLGTGKTGLVLVGAPTWAPSMFTGTVLLLALLAQNLEKTLEARAWVQTRRKRRAGGAEVEAGPA
jgi:ribose transport system permease protein